MPDLDVNLDQDPAASAPDDSASPSRDVPDGARDAWSEAAREVLTATAQRYHAVVTYKELAAEVQDRTGIHTRKLMQHWIGDVLKLVAADCERRGEPNLASLCVNAQGSVGAGYEAVVRAQSGSVPDDADAHAAQERLECYRAANAPDLPADGGRPSLSPKLQASRSRARVVAARDKPADVCPTCHMARLPNGVCDNCD